MGSKISYSVGSRFVSREGYLYVIVDCFVNGNWKLSEQRGRKKPVFKSVPSWAIDNNIRGGYWSVVES